MSESLLINICIVILFLPLLGFTTVVFFGKRIPKLYLFEVAILGIALLLSIIVSYVKLSFYNTKDIVAAFTWVTMGNAPSPGAISIELGFKIDNITVLMLFVVNLISFLVHVFNRVYAR